MRDSDDGAVVEHAGAERGLEHGVGFDVDGGGCFVQDKDIGRGEEGAGERDELALTGGEVGAAFVDGCVEFARHGGDVVLEAGVVCESG